MGLSDEARDVVDWTHFEKSRTELGPAFIRILSYFNPIPAACRGVVTD